MDNGFRWQVDSINENMNLRETNVNEFEVGWRHDWRGNGEVFQGEI